MFLTVYFALQPTSIFVIDYVLISHNNAVSQQLAIYFLLISSID